MIKEFPIRMCIVCKNRFFQMSLIRCRIYNYNLEINGKYGRSFYICQSCLKKDDKNLKKILEKYTKGLGVDVLNLKEKLLNEQC